jgi:hypothetical protein
MLQPLTFGFIQIEARVEGRWREPGVKNRPEVLSLSFFEGPKKSSTWLHLAWISEPRLCSGPKWMIGVHGESAG